VTAAVERVVFSTPRAAEFLELRALQAQTGQPVDEFGSVVIKELLDNALDAAETAGNAPVITITTEVDGDVQRVTVSDNGTGITADTITRICDFNNTVSDKARYRGPARGAQGNALKTLLGIPYALGVEAPVVIISQGIRHELKVMVDAVGDVIIAQEQINVDVIHIDPAGTSVSVPLPVDVEVDVSDWAFKTALVNPAATITAIDAAYSDGDTTRDIYKPSVEKVTKWLPAMPSSPWWYTSAAFSALVHSHIREAARTGIDMPLGKFISEFDGLSGSAKQKQIRAAAPGITHLSGLDGQSNIIVALHEAMKGIAKPTTPAKLGPVGKEHLAALLDDRYEVHRYWYRQETAVVGGIPWVIEVAIADTENAEGDIWYGTNHSPSFGDPLGRARLTNGDIETTGATSFLYRAGINGTRAAAVHVICAAAEFTDKGKVALVVPAEVADIAAKALAAATKVIRREDEQRRKDATKAFRAQQRARDNARRDERSQEWSLKDAVFEVIPMAKELAGDICAARTLGYKVRPLVQKYTDKELKLSYFTQTLLPEYERTFGAIDGLYYEARGYLYEPHTGKKIPLGTREVNNYAVPDHLFNKILYIEKEGLDTQLEPYQLAEKYDMAIAWGKGYAVTATRTLLARSEIRDMQVFVLHDADPAGYNIARTLAEATKRMPDHNIDVIDLGLTVPHAIEYGLETEQFTRQRALPSDLDLDDEALEWFTGIAFDAGRGKTHYDCTRCELNAFSCDGLAEFIEDRLREHGADTKLVPPQSVIDTDTAARRDELMTATVQREITAVIKAVAERLVDEVDIGGIDSAAVAAEFDSDPAQSWRDAVTGLVGAAIDLADITDRIIPLVIEQLGER
jgi:DNA topoisomerase VI subunit B